MPIIGIVALVCNCDIDSRVYEAFKITAIVIYLVIIMFGTIYTFNNLSYKYEK